MSAPAAPADLDEVLAALQAREPLFHRPELGTRRADYERMTVADYWETGASGRVYNRATVLDVLDSRRASPAPDVWRTEGFRCRQLAPDVFLLTYTLHQGERVTRRSTVWQRTEAVGWQAVYHQGTVVQPD